MDTPFSETDHQSSTRLWDVENREEVHEFPSDEIGGIMGLWDCRGFSPCGSFGSHWEQGLEKVPICLWEVATGKHIVTFWGHVSDIQAVAFSPNNELLASASFDGSILLWDLKPYM